MARKKSPTPDLLPDVTINPEMEVAQNLMSVMSNQYNDKRDLVNQLLGQAQMARSFAKFADVVSLSKLKYIKESKIYHELKGKKGVDLDGNEIADVGTWDGFCQALGLSRSKVDEDLVNLSAFGEDALKQLSAVGAGYRELRQFRRLPEDQKSALIEVAKEGDKTALLELAEEMIAKHAKEKEELKADLEVSRQMLAEKKEVINVMSTEREQLKARLVRRSATETPDEEGEAFETETIGFKNGVLSSMLDLECNFKLLASHTEQSGINHLSIMAATLDDIECRIINLRQQYNLPEFREIDGMDEWVKEALNEDEIAP
ncbi:TPA: hypothetical protein RU396_005850 [Klebsiella variicola subsp. variicola]|nr:hypothetical protein [Klebsiella variicola subsp. variicola]